MTEEKEIEKVYPVKYIPTGIVQNMTKKLVDECMNVDPNNWEVLDDSYTQKSEEEKPTLLEIMTDEVGEEELNPTAEKPAEVQVEPKAEAKAEGKNKNNKKAKAEAKAEGKNKNNKKAKAEAKAEGK